MDVGMDGTLEVEIYRRRFHALALGIVIGGRVGFLSCHGAPLERKNGHFLAGDISLEISGCWNSRRNQLVFGIA
jgi:hypothetical protein